MTPEQREDYEERAAIMEYDGKLERSEAERRALNLVLWNARKYEKPNRQIRLPG
jgi:hypothetical protein